MNGRATLNLLLWWAATCAIFALAGWNLGYQHGYEAHQTQAIKDKLVLERFKW